MKNNDIVLLAESYHNIYEAQQTTMQPTARIKNTSEFNTNLQTIDQLEDKIVDFISTAQSTGWMNAQEIASVKTMLESFITGILTSLLVSTEIKDNNQMQNMLKSISSKIKFVNIDKIAGLYNQAKSTYNAQTAGTAAAQSTQTNQSAQPPQPANLGTQPGNYRFQQALDTMNNFKRAGVGQ